MIAGEQNIAKAREKGINDHAQPPFQYLGRNGTSVVTFQTSSLLMFRTYVVHPSL